VSTSSSNITTAVSPLVGYSWIRTTINNTTTTWPFIGTTAATNTPSVIIGTSTSLSYIELPALTFVNGGKVYVDYGSGSNREFELQDVTTGTAVTTGITGGNGSVASRFKVDNTATYPRNTIVNNTLTLDPTLFNGVRKLRIAFVGGSDSRLFKISVYTAIDTPPTVQSTNITFPTVLFNGMTINWTNGNGAYRAVFIKENSGTIQNPIDGTVYTASADWNNKGTQLGSSGYYCIYNGNGSSVTITNLNPAISYTVQSFEYNGAGTLSKFFTNTATGNPASQLTKPLSAPTLSASVANILSTKITANAIISDGGTAPITEKGFVFNLTGNATTSSNTSKIISGTGIQNFSELIKNLNPSTKYYLKAYAINAIGTAYSSEVIFTTAVAAPVLSTDLSTIDFGSLYYKQSSGVLKYNLTGGGADLIPANGNINVVATGGFLLSLSSAGPFVSSLNIPYTGGKLPITPIYVQLLTNLYGNFTGTINHSGGGVLAADADIISLKGSVVQDELSNKGTDFWLGFGYMANMSNASKPAQLSLYVAAGEQDAQVTVEMPGVAGFTTQTVNVLANTVQEISGFPTGDNAKNPLNLPDSRLFTTGISDKGIHVYSNGVPVSVWSYSYTVDNSAAGAMIFPTNTWNSSYTVQAYGQGVNGSYVPNSFFYVVANEDNTEIEFTPSNPILKGTTAEMFNKTTTTANVLYDANPATPYKVTLNKGQIFNAMGLIDAGIGLDLSGTSIKTSCDKKIAVFAGNGRSLASSNLCSSPSVGSDNLIQQMFPTVAWGTKYLTVPTKSMEYNVFRIYVQDITTNVSVNGAILPKTAPNYNASAKYYNLEGNKPFKIESDKPINVTQLILSQSCGNDGGFSTVGNNGTGDPEMIILSPVQQAIKSTTVYSPNFKNGTPGGSYINVIIKKEGVASFKLDNLTMALDTGSNSFDGLVQFGSSLPVNVADAFKPHPGDAGYYYAKFKVSNGSKHTLVSDYAFNAIAYGMSTGESYGFNAGTAIKNLSSVKMSVNASATDTSTTVVRAAKGIPVRLKIALPYPPATVANLSWVVPSTDATITPAGAQNGASSGGVSTYESTILIDGRTFYVYASPTLYTFSQSGNHYISVLATGSFAGDCAGSDTQKIPVFVGLDNLNIAYQTNCGDPTISFTNTSTPMDGTNITKWLWDFGDGTTSILQNPPVHNYNKNNGSVYTVSLSTTNSAGIVSTKSIIVDFSGTVTAKFNVDAVGKAICAGGTVKFDAAASSITSAVSGIPAQWTWNFGDGSPNVVINTNSSPLQSHAFLATGVYTVKLDMTTSTGCTATFTDNITVYQLVPAVVNATSTVNSITFNWSAVADALSYQVSTDNGVTFTTPSSGTSGTTHTITGLSPDQTVSILVLAKGLGACSSISEASSAKTILPDLEVFIPNTFTPNGDGNNDEFLPYANYIQSMSIRIFNQWGEEVYHGEELNKGWDGNAKGKEQPVGVYVYLVNITMQNGDKINKRGTVNLIR